MDEVENSIRIERKLLTYQQTTTNTTGGGPISAEIQNLLSLKVQVKYKTVDNTQVKLHYSREIEFVLVDTSFSLINIFIF